MQNGKVLVVAGNNGGFDFFTELYDPVAQTWSIAGTLPSGLDNHVATLLPNGKVLVIGGEGPAGITNSVECMTQRQVCGEPLLP